jgi:hypothetical protein
MTGNAIASLLTAAPSLALMPLVNHAVRLQAAALMQVKRRMERSGAAAERNSEENAENYTS